MLLLALPPPPLLLLLPLCRANVFPASVSMWPI
jgi:hypothetical protein